METTKKLSLITVCDGCAQERFDHELQKVLNNILDVNTEATAVRKITLTVKIKPDEERESLRSELIVKPELAPLSPVSSLSLIGKDVQGNAEAHEVKPPKQLKFGIDADNKIQPIKKGDVK